MRASWFYRIGIQKPPVVCKSPKPPIISQVNPIILTIISVIASPLPPLHSRIQVKVEVNIPSIPFGTLLSVNAVGNTLFAVMIGNGSGSHTVLFNIPNTPAMLDVQAKLSGTLVAESYAVFAPAV